jgi:hypothetical protein
MQRSRNQRISAIEQFPAGARHPAAHQWRQVESVAIFVSQHQRVCDVVVAHRGALTVEAGASRACNSRAEMPVLPATSSSAILEA